MYDSLFSPSFGSRPRTLLGRDLIIRNFSEGLQTPTGSRDRTSLLLGQRGSGKTVLLLEMADLGRRMGFVTISPTVTAKGMLERILEKAEEEGAPFLDRPKSKVTGASIGILGVTAGIETMPSEEKSRSFAFRFIHLCRALNEQGKGLLILIDEVQANQEELKQLIIAYQEAIGEGLSLAMVLAGLPGAISATLNDHVLTFLNRAGKIRLLPLSIREIGRYYRQAFAGLKIDVSGELCDEAAHFTEGSPYMVQLVGHYITKLTMDDGVIDRRSFDEALDCAREDYENDICLTVLNSLSDKDREFLDAMAEDTAESRIADIAARIGVSHAYAQLYRRRLIAAGVVEPVRRGEIRIADPYMQNYLKKQL